jgi:hypothetical protein
MLEPVMQKDIADCSVACLVMLSGRSYRDVLAAFPKRARVGTEGVSDRQLMNAAKRLGCPLRYVRDGNLDGVVGILSLERVTEPGEEPSWHSVIVANGTIWNPAEGLLWPDIDAFFRARRWRPLGVFVKERSE